MIRNHDRGWMPRATVPLLMAVGLLSLATVSSRFERPGKSQGRGQGSEEAGWPRTRRSPRPRTRRSRRPRTRRSPRPRTQKKPEAKPQAKDEKKPAAKPEAKPAAARRQLRRPRPPTIRPSSSSRSRHSRRKWPRSKLKVATLELEKLGAIVSVDKAKDGKETATVNILKKWSGDKDALNLLKNVPNLQVVYVDNGQVNDAAVAPLKDLTGLSALTLMSPQVTDAGLDSLKGLTNLTMLFLTSSKVGDKGLPSLKGLKNLQVLALSRTQVTDAGLDALKDMKSLKSVYLIGTKVTPQAVDKLKQTIPGLAVYK